MISPVPSRASQRESRLKTGSDFREAREQSSWLKLANLLALLWLRRKIVRQWYPDVRIF